MLRLLTLLLFVSAAANAEFEVYLKEPNKIPLYAQETNVWCGAGSAQMMLEGFPNDVNHVHPQSYIWETIQDLKVEEDWYTDPDGLKNVMEEISGNTTWEAKCARSGSTPLMKMIVGSMATRKYPISVLVYGSAHWIVIIGATTDNDPNISSTVTLQKIEAFDPWKAQHVLVSGATWYQKYWYEPALSRSKWNGCYVAVHESGDSDYPLGPEMTVTPHASRGIVISSAQAEKNAKILLRKMAFVEGRTMEPLFVNHPRGAYYLIPVGDRRTGLSSGAMMINAFTGKFEAVSRFKEKFKYLDLRTARALAKVPKPLAWSFDFSPSQESRSPFHPVLTLYVAKDAPPVYVDQDGMVSTELHTLSPGS